MRRLRKRLVRPLLFALILVLGPLNAQTIFACMMMGGAELETCCCDDQVPAIVDFDDQQESCCEIRVELRVETSSEQDSPTTKPAEVRSDVDPPSALLVAYTPDPRFARALTISHQLQNRESQYSRSQTYLTTLRLRI